MAGISFLDKLFLNKNKTWHKLPHSENWWKLCMPWMSMQIRLELWHNSVVMMMIVMMVVLVTALQL